LSSIVLTQALDGNPGRTRGRTRRIAVALCFLASVGIATTFALPALAGSRSGVVTVSVQVVESCRIETSSTGDGIAADLRMRCNSKARPSLGATTQSQTMAPAGIVSVPYSQLATTENGKVLSINF
jgi:hypothetical protein